MATGKNIRMGGAYIEIGAVNDKLLAVLNDSAAKLRSFSKFVASIGATMAGFGLAPIAGLFALSASAAKAGDDLQNLSDRTGLAVDEITALRSIAEDAGGSIEAVEGAIRKLQVNISALEGTAGGVGQAIAGGFGDMADAADEAGDAALGSNKKFAQFGLTLSDFKGKSTYEQLLVVADAMAKIDNPARRAYLATQLLGKGGAALIPILSNGASAVREYKKRLDELGITLGDQAAASVNAYDDLLASVVRQFGAIKNVVGAAAANTFEPYIRAAQPLIAAAIRFASTHEEIVHTVILSSAAIASLGGGLLVLGGTLAVASFAVSGFASLLGVVTAPIGILSGLIFSAVGAASSFAIILGTLTKILGASVFGAAATAVSGLSSALLSVVGASVSAGLAAVATAVGLIGSVAAGSASLVAAAFAGIPAAIAAVGVAASAVAGVVGTALASTAALIESAIFAAIIAIAPAVTAAVAALEAIGLAIASSLLSGFLAIVPAVAATVSAVVSAFSLLAPALAVVATIAAVSMVAKFGPSLISGIGGVVAQFGAIVGDAFNAVLNTAASIFAGIGRAALAGISAAYAAAVAVVGQIGGFFTSIGASIAAGFSAAVSIVGRAAEVVGSFFAAVPGIAREGFSSILKYGGIAFDSLVSTFGALKAILGGAFDAALSALKTGNLALAGEIAIAGLELAWAAGVLKIKTIWFEAKDAILNYAIDKYIAIGSGFQSMILGMAKAWINVQAIFKSVWNSTADYIGDVYQDVLDRIERARIYAVIQDKSKRDEQLDRFEKSIKDRQAAQVNARINSPEEAKIKREQDAALAAANKRYTDSVAELEKMRAKKSTENPADKAAIAAAEKRVADLSAKLQQLEFQSNRAESFSDPFARDKFANPLAGLDQQLRQTRQAVGTFSAGSISALFAGQNGPTPKDKTEDNTARTAKATETIAEAIVRNASRKQTFF